MRLLKKLFLGFCVFCLVILIAITAVPFFVNVDQYRPQIVQAVNERINGKLELGKLSLSLWGQIRVEVGGLKLFDTKENQIVSVKDAWFHFPFLSILSGAPTLNFKMIKPELSVVKDKNGSLNVLTLMKQPVAVDTSKTLQEGQKITPQKFELPGIVSKAVLGVEVLQALLVYRDVTLSKEPQSVKNLNLRLKNISLEQATELEIWGNIDGSKLKDTLSIRGPFRISGNARPELVQKRFDKITIDLLGNFDDIEVLVPDLFEKKKGVKAQFKAQMQSSFEKASVTAVATFFNAEFKVQGSVANFNQPQVEFSIKSNEIALNPWNSLVYSLKSYDLGGVASLEAGINGSAQQLGYKAQVQFKNVTAKAPHLKSQPQIDGAVKVSTNQIESFWVTLKAPGNDLKVQGRLVSFEKPSIEVSVVSAGIDLDQLIDFPRPSKLAKSATSADYDTMLKPM
ncbi:MAG: hypothetical protein HY072_02215, partial [Deltaproteobacteria bacterium]|nr:hypothetical protein [Deltaproteobacteria bacterium]